MNRFPSEPGRMSPSNSTRITPSKILPEGSRRKKRGGGVDRLGVVAVASPDLMISDESDESDDGEGMEKRKKLEYDSDDSSDGGDAAPATATELSDYEKLRLSKVRRPFEYPQGQPRAYLNCTLSIGTLRLARGASRRDALFV